MVWAIALHAGAGGPPKVPQPLTDEEYKDALREALEVGKHILTEGGSAAECVEKVVRFLEDFPYFNAGKGSVFTEEGNCVLEASIMDGKGSVGSALGLTHIKNPISLARSIMEDKRKPYVMFSGEAAEALADKYNIEKVENSYFHTEYRKNEWERVKQEIQVFHVLPPETKSDSTTGTVGCAALDTHGNLCAGTSTGGTTNKPAGRIGDTPIIGAGTYANSETCAVSGTGRGERFIQQVVCFDVHALMLYKERSLSEAMKYVTEHKLKEGDGGIIGVDKNGEVAMHFNTARMFRAGANSQGLLEVKIWKEDERDGERKENEVIEAR